MQNRRFGFIAGKADEFAGDPVRVEHGASVGDDVAGAVADVPAEHRGAAQRFQVIDVGPDPGDQGRGAGGVLFEHSRIDVAVRHRAGFAVGDDVVLRIAD